MTPTGIVVDVGGTTTRVSLHHGDHLVGSVVRFPTPSPRTDPDSPLDAVRDALFDRIATHVDELRAGQPVERVGVAFGAVVSNTGVVRDASVLWLRPGTGFDVAAALRTRLPWARVTVLNDVSAAAWHYRRLGSFALVTVSTGLAVKVFAAGDAGPENAADVPPERRLVLDPDGVGGESGHTVVEPTLVRQVPAALRAAVATGDPAARAELERLGLPWCECGAVADLCAYASGPAAARSATAAARRDPDGFARSVLADLNGGDPARIDPTTIAAAARRARADGIDDPFVDRVLRDATRALAARLLQLCADVGLRTVVVVGGFAHGVGPSWLDALRRNLTELVVRSGWYAGWSAADLDSMVTMPADADDAPLRGMAAYVTARADRIRVAVKPVGDGRLVLHSRPRPRCGREQVVLRPVFAGVCGTDLQMLRGERGCEPGIPGHEVVAELVEVGADVTGLCAGDLVTLNPNNPRDDDDKIGHSRPGVFGELLVFDAGVVRRGQMVTVPGPARVEHVLIEPLAAVLRAGQMTARAHAAATGPVLVVGAGVAGLLHALVARHHGARTVLVASRSAATRARAVALGVCPPGHALALDATLADTVATATAGAGVDTAVIAVGGRAGPASVALTWPALAAGAAVHLFGGFPAGSRLPLADGRCLDVGPVRAEAGTRAVTGPLGRPAVVMGSRGGQAADFAAAVALCAAGSLPLGRLVSHIVSLSALPVVAAELAVSGTVDGRRASRVVVDFRRDGHVVDEIPFAGVVHDG